MNATSNASNISHIKTHLDCIAKKQFNLKSGNLTSLVKIGTLTFAAHERQPRRLN